MMMMRCAIAIAMRDAGKSRRGIAIVGCGVSFFLTAFDTFCQMFGREQLPEIESREPIHLFI